MCKHLSNLILYFFLGTIALVVLFKFVPVPFTPLMLIRQVEARSEGRRLEIHHEWVPIEEISPELIAAVIDEEDARFYEHRGFDWDAIQCAHRYNQRMGKSIRGGSTISQQTAKNIFCTPSRTYVRKVFEAYFTILIEFIWGKERIMEVYLNSIEMGDGVFGAEAAANYHFRTSAAALDRYEAYYIARGLCNPGLYLK
jgi:monofunctional biosynthetic peptidoglycan transglycosylase